MAAGQMTFEDALQRRNQELAALNAIAAGVGQSLDLRLVLDAALAQTLAVLNAEGGVIHLFDEASQTFAPAAHRGVSPNVVREVTGFRIGQGLGGCVAETARPLIVPDLAADPRNLSPSAVKEGWQSLVGVPLCAKGKTVGVLIAVGRAPGRFTTDNLSLLLAIGSQIGAAIENARLFEETRRLKGFNESIVQGVAEAILIEDAQGILTFANPAAEELLGYTRQELVGRHWTAIVPEDERARVSRETEKRPQGIGGRYETALLGKGGRVIPVIVSARPLFEGDRFVGVLAAFTDITEHRRTDEALRRRVEELAALHKTALEITMPHDLPGLLHATVERAAHLLDAPGGGLYLCDPERQEVRCVVSYNTPRDFTGTALKYGEGAAGIVAQTGRPLIIDDYRTWSGRAAVYEREKPFSAVLSAPMIWQGQVTGVIHVLHNTETRRFTEHDLELLTMFASQAAIAVENARLLEATRRRAAELEALAELSAALRTAQTADEMVRVCLQKSAEIGGMAVGIIYRVEPETGDLVVWGWYPPELPLQTMRHRAGEGIAGHVAVTGEPYSTPDFHTDPRAHVLPEEVASIGDVHASISLPLRAGQGQIVGVMQLGRTAVHQFSDAETRLLVAIAEMAGNALHRAQMMETLEERVAARTSELRAANARLRDLERLKSQFLANASHELRTPLTNIIAYLDLLARGKPEKREHYMNILRRQADVLHRLIEGLLDVADLDFGKAQPALAPVDLNQLVETMLETCQVLVSDRNPKLQTDLVAGLPWVWGDVKMLKQVITNLVGNAAEQTTGGGTILLRTRRREEAGQVWSTFAVETGGPGLKPEERVRLQALIERREAARSSTTPGLGLRLAICQEIAQRHGGKITVESEVGRGSVFTLWLPAGDCRLSANNANHTNRKN